MKFLVALLIGVKHMQLFLLSAFVAVCTILTSLTACCRLGKKVEITCRLMAYMASHTTRPLKGSNYNFITRGGPTSTTDRIACC